MSWQPSPESTAQLAACLKDSLSGFDKNAQKQAELMLQQAKSSPDVNNYLAYLFSSTSPPQGVQCGEQDYHLVRSAAGIMLKNNIKSEWKSIPAASLEFVKMAVPMGLEDKNSQIRNFAGNVATEIIRKGGLMEWPSLLQDLLNKIKNADGQVSNEAQEGAMSALSKICEDNFRMLMREVNGQRPLNVVLPELIAATKNPLPKVRVGALTAINVFTSRESQAMLNSIDSLLQHLFILAADENTDVRRQVCRAFVQLVETRPDKLQPHISGLVDYILTQQKSEDEDLALEAAEFWLAVGEHDNLWQALSPYTNRIIPVLLECMIYSGEDIALLGGLSDDEEEEDRQEDIKPTFAKKTQARSAAADASASNDPNQNGNAYQKLANMEDELEDGEIDEVDDGDDMNPDERWTVRKCSAAALDVFARDFRGPVFEAILPYLTDNLKHGEWPNREAAVLALGAVAEGCMESVTPHLPELVPYLITLLEDEEPVVRTITCWTLGRYSEWAAHLTDPAKKEQFFVPMMDGILRKMLDKNKKVQEAGASAFANLEDKAGKNLEPYCGPIIQQFVRCFGKYKDRNMYMLYDCVQTLAERIGSLLANSELVDQLMPALIDRYQKVTDQAREVFPLLETLSYIAVALGDSFTPYASPIFTRCVTIISTNLEQTLAAIHNPGLDQPDKDFLIVSLDLLSSIIQALDQPKVLELVNNNQHSFFDLLSFCMEDPTDEVRQSAYALLGDCARVVYPQLEPYLQTILPILISQMDMDSILDSDLDGGFGVVNNACWSSGEIAMQHGKKMAPYIKDLLPKLVEIMTNPGVPKGLSENAALAIGRLGVGSSEELAPAIGSYAEDFLTAMIQIDPSEEKATAFKGFGMTVARNPQAIEKVVMEFFTAIARYQDPELPDSLKQELHEVFQHVLSVYKSLIPQFNDFINQMQQRDQDALKSAYSI